jgi:hypothetical protein
LEFYVLVQDIVRDLNAHLLTTSEPQIPAAELGLVIRVFGDALFAVILLSPNGKPRKPMIPLSSLISTSFLLHLNLVDRAVPSSSP